MCIRDSTTCLDSKPVTVKAENGKVKTYTLGITRSKAQKVRVSVSELNMRTGPGTVYKSKGKLKKGVYIITPVSYTHLDVYKRQGVYCAV